MSSQRTNAQFVFDDDVQIYRCEGDWSILLLEDLPEQFDALAAQKKSINTISGQGIKHFDSAGALALLQGMQQLSSRPEKIKLIDFTEKQLGLIELIKKQQKTLDFIPPPPKEHHFFYQLGLQTVHKLEQVDGLIILIGILSEKLIGAASHWKRIQLPSVISNIKSTGVQALPIIALLSFLIGVVLAYQMGLQLENYGANNFIAYLSGLACFREFAPLITAIIVAGRTSSAFTAQLGTMKINEEIDALETMGLSPVELLVLPKLMGLLIVFPLIIFWADIFSIGGAMLLSKLKLDVGYLDFIIRLKDSVGAKQMLLGLYKAPVFAVLIALVGCYQGFNVESNAGSIGSQTTKSVVQSLFLIIIADAAFSVAYSWLQL